MSEHVTLYEVGPRDGLQNESRQVAVAEKVALITALAQAGLCRIEVGSFVSPKWVPQMANTAEVVAALPAMNGVTFAALVPNMRGWQSYRAAAASRQDFEVAVFISATEGFSQSNLNCSVAQSLALLRPVIEAATGAGVPSRGYVSCTTDCPFDGPTAPQHVADVVGQLRDLSPMPVSLGETLGHATPERVAAMLEAVLQVAPADQLAGHFHDTDGRALQSIAAALALGLRTFDSAIGGLGGCPYAPGAPGNVATEAVADLLARLGYETGIDRSALAQAAELAKAMR